MFIINCANCEIEKTINKKYGIFPRDFKGCLLRFHMVMNNSINEVMMGMTCITTPRIREEYVASMEDTVQ